MLCSGQFGATAPVAASQPAHTAQHTAVVRNESASIINEAAPASLSVGHDAPSFGDASNATLDAADARGISLSPTGLSATMSYEDDAGSADLPASASLPSASLNAMPNPACDAESTAATVDNSGAKANPASFLTAWGTTQTQEQSQSQSQQESATLSDSQQHSTAETDPVAHAPPPQARVSAPRDIFSSYDATLDNIDEDSNDGEQLQCEAPGYVPVLSLESRVLGQIQGQDEKCSHKAGAGLVRIACEKLSGC